MFMCLLAGAHSNVCVCVCVCVCVLMFCVAFVGVMFGKLPAEDVIWESKTKIHCVTPAGGSGSVPVIVTTKNGGAGTCTVEYFFEPTVVKEIEDDEITLTTEVATWIDEATLAPPAVVHLVTGHSVEDPLHLGETFMRKQQAAKAAAKGKAPAAADPLDVYTRLHPKANGSLSSADFDPVWSVWWLVWVGRAVWCSFMICSQVSARVVLQDVARQVQGQPGMVGCGAGVFVAARLTSCVACRNT